MFHWVALFLLLLSFFLSLFLYLFISFLLSLFLYFFSFTFHLLSSTFLFFLLLLIIISFLRQQVSVARRALFQSCFISFFVFAFEMLASSLSFSIPNVSNTPAPCPSCSDACIFSFHLFFLSADQRVTNCVLLPLPCLLVVLFPPIFQDANFQLSFQRRLASFLSSLSLVCRHLVPPMFLQVRPPPPACSHCLPVLFGSTHSFFPRLRPAGYPPGAQNLRVHRNPKPLARVGATKRERERERERERNKGLY